MLQVTITDPYGKQKEKVVECTSKTILGGLFNELKEKCPAFANVIGNINAFRLINVWAWDKELGYSRTAKIGDFDNQWLNRTEKVEFILPLEFKGSFFAVDSDGFIEDPDNKWNEELAVFMAGEDGLSLTDEHWEIIRFLRDYFQKYQIAPMIKILTKEIGKTMGKEKGNTKYLYELYPNGPAKQACRYAGLPRPTG